MLPQLLQTQPIGLVAAQDPLDDVRCEAGQAEHAADVGAVAADVLGQVFKARVLARFELRLPAVPLGDGLDQRPVGTVRVLDVLRRLPSEMMGSNRGHFHGGLLLRFA